MLMPLEKERTVKVMVAVGIILGIGRRSRQREGQSRETLLRSIGILSVLNRGLLRDQSRNEGITQPFLVAVGTPLPFDNQHSVDVARGESPKNVSRFFFVEPRSQSAGLDEKGYGGSLGVIPTAFFFPLDCRQF